MVDFTAPINNADMVKGLNKLIQANAQLLDNLDIAEGGLQDDALAYQANELRAMHEHHIERIGEAIRVLGGAPHRHEGGNWSSDAKMQLSKLGKERRLASAIYTEEEKLHHHYAGTRDKLRASPEVVEVIEELLQDSSQKLSHFEAAAERRH